MDIIDISPSLSSSSPVFPGDTEFNAEPMMVISRDASKECPVNVARLTLSTHTGAHADAPLHYHKDAAPIDAVDLEPYLGPCTVIHLIKQGALIYADQVADALAKTNHTLHQRILIRTYARHPVQWDAGFSAISAEAIDWLASQGVRLIGVDTASLDPASSKIMDAHNAIYKNDMRILEGLKLDDVAPGEYELIALPLKLEGLDAAPVRAVLRMLR